MIWVEWVEWALNSNGGTKMIAKQDIDNVKTLIQKTSQFASSEIEKSKFDRLLRELDAAGNKFIKEVTYDVRLS